MYLDGNSCIESRSRALLTGIWGTLNTRSHWFDSCRRFRLHDRQIVYRTKSANARESVRDSKAGKNFKIYSRSDDKMAAIFQENNDVIRYYLAALEHRSQEPYPFVPYE